MNGKILNLSTEHLQTNVNVPGNNQSFENVCGS